FTVSLGLGSMLPALLTAPLAGQLGGWRFGLGFWLVLPLSAVITWTVLRLARSVPEPGRSQTRADGQQKDQPPRRSVLASPKARYMAMFFGLQSANAYVQFGWLPQIYRDAGLDPVLAGIMLTIVTFGGLPGGFLAPQIIVRGIAPRAFLVSFGGSAVLGCLGLLFAPPTTPLVWGILFGYGGLPLPPGAAPRPTRARPHHLPNQGGLGHGGHLGIRAVLRLCSRRHRTPGRRWSARLERGLGGAAVVHDRHLRAHGDHRMALGRSGQCRRGGRPGSRAQWHRRGNVTHNGSSRTPSEEKRHPWTSTISAMTSKRYSSRKSR